MSDNTKSKSKRPTAAIPSMPEDLSSAPAPVVPSAHVEAVPAPLPTPAPDAVDYGLMDSLKSGQAAVTEATQKFIQKLGEYLSTALDDATSLEVRTYVSSDINTVTYDKGQFAGGARLRALTRVNIDGDSIVCVPETDGELDTAVWGVHMDMLKQAQESRAELLKTIVTAASSLANIVTPKS
jgi:hypothetical protein